MKPLEVGLKLTTTLRHLATVETYTFLQYHWLVGRTNICKFILQICQAILDEFQVENLYCTTDSEDWKRWRSSEPDGMPSHDVGAIDGKHIKEYRAEYRFLLVNVGSSGTDFLQKR